MQAKEYNTYGKYGDGLINLCNECMAQTNIEKTVEYFPNLLDEEKLIFDLENDEVSGEEIFDTMQSFYLFALLKGGKPGEFESEVVTRFPDFKTVEFKYHTFISFVERFKLTDEQMETFGDAFGKVYKTDIDYPEKIQIITLQTLLYDRCGASEKFEAVRVQSEKLQEEIDNQPIQSIEN